MRATIVAVAALLAAGPAAAGTSLLPRLAEVPDSLRDQPPVYHCNFDKTDCDLRRLERKRSGRPPIEKIRKQSSSGRPMTNPHDGSLIGLVVIPLVLGVLYIRFVLFRSLVGRLVDPKRRSTLVTFLLFLFFMGSSSSSEKE
jgi:hypothetical protein